MQDQYTSKVFDIDYTPSRKKMREARVMSEAEVLDQLKLSEKTDVYQRIDFQKKTSNLIRDIRASNQPDLLSLFISEYNLTSDEGLSLMTLVEAFLRVPDNKTRDKLFIDKVARKGWARHISGSKSSMVNIATIALSIADRMITNGSNNEIKNRVKKALEILSRPGIRFSANNVMQFFAKQFVFAENIKTAIKSSKAKNGLYSFDMLGEAAWTMADADKYFLSYKNALIEIGKHRQSKNVFEADGISVKLSALHPKYDFMHRERVLSELLPRIIELVNIAQKYNIGINIDAEEAERLDLSLDVIDRIMDSISNTSWQGFGVVVQAYQKRSPYVIDWLYQSCKKYNLKIMVRLVKGAYWDSEIKKAQVMGEVDYPVFTKKINTDYSFLVCAQKLLLMRNFIYPQFASHNAHSLVSVCEIAGDNVGFEVQRLHGMGESLHIHIKNKYNVLSRVYAPIGSHKELLAYLMRRLLENGANSSFINHLFDENIKPESLAIDVFSEVEKDTNNSHSKIPLPKDIFKNIRQNSSSIMLTEQNEVDLLFQSQEPWLKKKWQAKSMISGIALEDSNQEEVKNPSDTSDIVGSLLYANQSQLDRCLITAQNAFNLNSHYPDRIHESLNRAAELYEENQFELMALAMREAGKTYQDAIDEVREAVDFLRYYSNLAHNIIPNKRQAMGVFVCISPWNFPLAIFTGQVAAALAAGNVVIAKPAESTSLIAYRASELLIEAGIPLGVFQLCLGKGSDVGSYLTSSSIISGVAFTGSSAVAKQIKHNLIKNGNPGARVIAETGGLNAMIVDSTALCEQVTRDVIDGAFKSAGQRCSALRILMIQDECFDETLKMIQGAMMELHIGNSKHLSTDCGPVINHDAKVKLQGYIENSRKRNQIIGEIQCDLQNGYYVTPTIINLKSIDEINEEFFGPILHVISYKSDELESMIDQLNAKGFGLTFGIHSRINKQVEEITSRVNAGNIYVNRNQIGAVVGSQPFGGEGLSGTGPKAGGPSSLHGYSQSIASTKTTDHELKLYGNAQVNNLILPSILINEDLITKMKNQFSFIESDFFDFLHDEIAKYATKISLPGPTGESNSIRYKPKGTALCLGPTAIDALKQTLLALVLGNSVISLIKEDEYNSLIMLGFGKESIFRLVNGPSLKLMKSESYKVILFFGNLMSVEKLIVNQRSAITPVMSSLYETWQLVNERVITEDTTASGGNANLLAL
ncbi:bifunctional proline dehydrogenase/L-glutamate gamma-semialdehyde dehydrogenase PutA [Candidatus Pseudothioglobus sp. Uisw_050_01]|uniref:bifunctional proline dehydrogenase/L-glutamate gamma-semialdehyde dehydrogenase PutA n=1 Tax=Candidatus Pseudothioglobus sp. Uisw_050_01 TaxID=3230997 RepID=UPI003A84E6C1